MFPPALMNLRILKPEKRVRLWLPLFLLWPLLPVAAAIAVVAVLLAALFTFRFRRMVDHFRTGGEILKALCLLRELRVDVKDPKEEIRVAFY